MSLISLSLSIESYDSQSPTRSTASSVSPNNNNNNISNKMFKRNNVNYKNNSAILQLNFQDLELSHNDGKYLKNYIFIFYMIYIFFY